MKPGKFATLRSYLNRKYYHGHIRWLLKDKEGRHVYCYACGNIANGVVSWRRASGRVFNFPICKAHLQEHFPLIESCPCHIIIDYRIAERALVRSPLTEESYIEND